MNNQAKPPIVVDNSDLRLTEAEELPIVARLVVEVRSDGRRTIARGVMEDAATGTKAAIEASGRSPLELALALAKSMLQLPGLTSQVVRSRLRKLLPSPPKPDEQR